MLLHSSGTLQIDTVFPHSQQAVTDGAKDLHVTSVMFLLALALKFVT